MGNTEGIYTERQTQRCLPCVPSSKSSGVCIQPRVTAETRTVKTEREGGIQRGKWQDIDDMKRKRKNVERALIVGREDNKEE